MKDKHIVAWALVLGCVIVLAFQSFWVIKRQPHSPQPFMQQRNNRYQQYSGWQTKLNSNHHSSSSNNNNKVFSIPNNNGQHNIKAKQKGIVISGDTFYDEENLAPLRILSGEFHYFRTPRVYWRDRLEKMRLGGLNTVSLYVPWNMHEPVPGLFNFAGELDLGAVITEAAAAGLYVIVRPGPYICAEWEFGGLPAWLLARNIRIRTSDPEFLSAANGYLEKVLDIVRPLQRTQGGPVIAMQIENEYGSYGSDMTYMKILRQLFRENGIDCFLFDSNKYRISQHLLCIDLFC